MLRRLCPERVPTADADHVTTIHVLPGVAAYSKCPGDALTRVLRRGGRTYIRY